MSAGYRKSNLEPDFVDFPCFSADFWVIFDPKMTDFELGPECRPEFFEVYLGILPGPFLGPPGPSLGPAWDPEVWDPDFNLKE